MGDLVQFRKPGFAACPCGWHAPRNIQVELYGVKDQRQGTNLAVVLFDCPQCGTRLQMGQAQQKAGIST